MSLAHTAGHLLLILQLIEPKKTLGSECPGIWGSGRGRRAGEEGKGGGSTLVGACLPALRMVRCGLAGLTAQEVTPSVQGLQPKTGCLGLCSWGSLPSPANSTSLCSKNFPDD